MDGIIKISRIKRENPLQKSFAEAFASVEAEIEYRKLAVVEELLQFMKREGVSRSELAERMGVGPSRITAMLNGSSNLTIETLVRAGHAVGADLQQAFVPKGQTGHWITARGPNGLLTLPSVSFYETPPKKKATKKKATRKSKPK